MVKLSHHQSTLNDLVEGNKRFISGVSNVRNASSKERLREYAQKGQRPKAVILCCSDSRAPVEMIFDQDVGELFVIRVAGNIVAPSLVGSVEFAAANFGTPTVLVMGHTHCGAIQATIDHIAMANQLSSENIHDILSRIRPHIFQTACDPRLTPEQKMHASVEANVRASVAQLSHSSRLIEDLVQKQDLYIVGAVLDLDSGKVNFLPS